MSNYMGLESIDSSDYVSPTPINNNFAKLDALGRDYVVESGKSGEWWYRKWKSGRAECGIDWKDFGNQKLHMDANLGNAYETTDLSFGAYPFSFTKRPFAHVQWEGDANVTWRGAYAVTRHTTSTTQSPSFFIVDWISQDMHLYAGIYVCGTYK